MRKFKRRHSNSRLSGRSKLALFCFVLIIAAGIGIYRYASASPVVLRQEINILDSTVATSSTSSEIVQLDTTKYSGSVTYYFEVVTASASASTDTVTLTRSGTSTNDASISLAGTGSITRVRSSSFTPPTGVTEYVIKTGANHSIKAARILILQSTTPLTATETQIEIGNKETSKSNTAASPLNNPKYWKYTSANWNGGQTFFAEVTKDQSASSTTVTVTVQKDNGSFSGWTDVATIVSNTTTAIARSRVTFTALDGLNYRISSTESTNASGETYSLYNAKIILDQSSGITRESFASGGTGANTLSHVVTMPSGVVTGDLLIVDLAFNGNPGTITVPTGWTLLASDTGQSNPNVYTYYKLSNGTEGSSLTWTISNSIYSGWHAVRYSGVDQTTPLDAAAVPSDSGANTTFSATGITTVTDKAMIVAIFAANSSVNRLSTSSTLVTEFSRIFGTSIKNTLIADGLKSPAGATGTIPYATNLSIAGVAIVAALRPSSGGGGSSITLVEPQYLLLNTADSNSTGPQGYPTNWNLAEWSGCTNTYKFAMDSDNSSNSAKLQDVDNNYADITSATATGVNQQISSTFSMPTSGHNIDVSVIDTTGVIAAARLILDVSIGSNCAPSAPTLSTPIAGATGVLFTPQFQLRSSDADNDYLRYKIDVCSTNNCSSIVRTIDQTSSQTGWSAQDQQASTAYTGNIVITSSTMATHTYQTTALSAGTQYWWRGYAIDPGGTNTFSSASAIQTFTTNFVPAAPTLVFPAASATGISTLPIFNLRTTDTDSDYLQYFIQIYTATACGGSQVGSNIDQTSSQTQWQGQDANAAAAYAGSSTIANSTMARYEYAGTALIPNHLYSWRAKAIDPAGSNTFSSLSSCQDFTTNSSEASIQGGTTINGGTTIQ